MKIVYQDKAEVSHLWAHQAQERARYKESFFFEGRALWSYGSHYLCGFVMPGDVVFLNTEKHSVTTGVHQGLARSATSHMTQYSMPNLTGLIESLNLAAKGLAASAIRKTIKAYKLALAEGNLGAINWEGQRESAAQAELLNWLKRCEAESGIEGARWLAKRIGLTQGEVNKALRAGDKRRAENKAYADRQEREELDRKGKILAGMTLEQFAAEWPDDGNGTWGAEKIGTKPYDLQRMEEYGRKVSRLHKRAKQAGYNKRAAAIWLHLKAYRAHLAGRDARLIAAHRSSLAQSVVDWRNGKGRRPMPYRFANGSAISRALIKAEAAEQHKNYKAKFDLWQDGEGERPSSHYFAEGTPERQAIDCAELAEKLEQEQAYLAWKADSSAPRPKARAFLSGTDSQGREYCPGNFTASYGVTYSRYTIKDSPLAEMLAAHPFAMAWTELGDAERAEAQALENARREEKRLEQESRRAQALLDFRQRGVVAGELSDDKKGALLTVVGDQLVTSWGARVPLSDATKVFRFAKLCRENKKAWHANGKRVYCGHYQIDKIMTDGSFKAGCHLIHWPEIEAAAKLAGVAEMEASDSALAGNA